MIETVVLWLILSFILLFIVNKMINKKYHKNEYDELDRKIDEENRKTYSEMGPGIYFREHRTKKEDN